MTELLRMPVPDQRNGAMRYGIFVRNLNRQSERRTKKHVCLRASAIRFLQRNEGNGEQPGDLQISVRSGKQISGLDRQ